MNNDELQEEYENLYKDKQMVMDNRLREEYKEIYDYLYFIKEINKLDISSAYGVDQKRTELHYEMFLLCDFDLENNSDMYFRSKALTGNLEVMIDFDLVRNVVTPIECINMNHWLRCAEFSFFMEGKTTGIRANGKVYS